MRKSIYKYPLSYDPFTPIAAQAVTGQQLNGASEVELKLPKDARFLHVMNQQGTPVVYALVDTEAEPETRKVWLIYTGATVPDDCLRSGIYLGTFNVGPLVIHTFVT